VLEKVGMTKEGEHRDYFKQKGIFWDFNIYAILRKEFSKR